ncbi:regulator of chromosome condensation isoform X2 [Brachionus plicatilis]|uniref:Regulator of chromosome condensation isoform X2 n=1 Tax=Brachionus plicatilis TaxID=10195 RepID=A0A3M7QNZ0_BRAPC|nr:regulator of chromosome condensation isoform X2 [Brachionus plicatilis]
MPLSSRINKSEPRTKRAKTERKSSGSATASTRSSSRLTPSKQAKHSSEDEDLVEKQVEVKVKKGAKKSDKTKAESSDSADTSNTTSGVGTLADDAAMSEETTPVKVSKGVDTIGAVPRPDKPGLVLSVGENLSNQLGLGAEIDNRKKPQVIKELPDDVIQIAAGGMHSACLTKDGLVYTFGCNDEFALGRDNDDEIDKVELPEKIVEISAGDSHTAALTESGTVYAWGTFRDGSGVLGMEQKRIAKVPMKFSLKVKVEKISSGADHLVFLARNGDVYTAGNSEHGQLGRVSKYNSCRGGRRGSDMILAPGLVRFGKRKELAGHKQIENAWTTPYCTFLKVRDADVIIGFGLNNSYQLGIEDCENRYQPDVLTGLKFEGSLVKVIGGMHHTLFLDSLGFVYAMGSHRYGSLGLGKIDADVKLPVKIDELKDIVDIAANTNVSYAIDKSGKAYCWGTNYSKQLGLDTEDDYLTPNKLASKQIDVRDVYTVSVGGQHTLFVVSEEKD